MNRKKYVVLSLLTLVSVMLAGLLYSSIVQANSTVTGYVSVPAAAFVVSDSTANWRCSGGTLSNWDTGGLHFYGSVQLPHGATVTNVTFYWYDSAGGQVGCYLYRYNQTHTLQMAYEASSGAAGAGSSYDDEIDYATVDNSQNTYYVDVNIIADSGSYSFHYAVIEYTLPIEAAVGGFWIPVDKFSLVAPYLALVATIIVAVSISAAYIKYRKK